MIEEAIVRFRAGCRGVPAGSERVRVKRHVPTRRTGQLPVSGLRAEG